MTKNELHDAVSRLKQETGTALQLIYDSLNQGQRKKLVKDEAVKELFDRYGVQYDE